MLKTAPRPSLDGRVLTAVRWIGRGAVAERPHESFLYHMIALESLLVGSTPGTEIAYRLRLRAVQLLARSKTRKELLAKQVAALYTIRSKIVHGGQEAVSPKDLDTMKALARGAVLAVLKGRTIRRYRRSEELDEWFEQRAMGS